MEKPTVVVNVVERKGCGCAGCLGTLALAVVGVWALGLLQQITEAQVMVVGVAVVLALSAFGLWAERRKRHRSARE